MPMGGITSVLACLGPGRGGRPGPGDMPPIGIRHGGLPNRLKSSIKIGAPPAPPRFGLGPRIRTNVGTSARRRVRQRRRRRVTETAEIGVFGGSGFYSLLDDVREVKVDTPYGAPSDSVFLAE